MVTHKGPVHNLNSAQRFIFWGSEEKLKIAHQLAIFCWYFISKNSFTFSNAAKNCLKNVVVSRKYIWFFFSREGCKKIQSCQLIFGSCFRLSHRSDIFSIMTCLTIFNYILTSWVWCGSVLSILSTDVDGRTSLKLLLIDWLIDWHWNLFLILFFFRVFFLNDK